MKKRLRRKIEKTRLRKKIEKIEKTRLRKKIEKIEKTRLNRLRRKIEERFHQSYQSSSIYINLKNISN